MLTTNRALRIGSLFSGYGGLDMGVTAALKQLGYEAEVAWHVEYDEAPSRILAHHWPDVPNYGDVSKVDWSAVEPVDVLTGGFPCQDVSLAGLRKGLAAGTRSGLWSEFAVAIAALRPRLVVIENVRGLLSAIAGSPEEVIDEEIAGYLEHGPQVLGDTPRDDRPVLRALGAVLGDLADIGYNARWCGIRASDAGATHGRFRVFIVAEPSQDTDIATGSQRRITAPGQAEAGRTRTDVGGRDRAPAADTDDIGRRADLADIPQEQSNAAGSDAPDDTCDDGRRWSTERHVGEARRLEAPQRVDADGCVSTDTDHDAAREGLDARGSKGGGTEPAQRGGPAADAGGERLGQHSGEPSSEEARPFAGDIADGDGRLRPHTDWGPYRLAVERWERIIGRRAPEPTNPDGRNGARRLAPQFTEWMMGLPVGHVTDPAIGLSRNAQLKACGNGVVPQQATLAVMLMAPSMQYGLAA